MQVRFKPRVEEERAHLNMFIKERSELFAAREASVLLRLEQCQKRKSEQSQDKNLN